MASTPGSATNVTANAGRCTMAMGSEVGGGREKLALRLEVGQKTDAFVNDPWPCSSPWRAAFLFLQARRYGALLRRDWRLRVLLAPVMRALWPWLDDRIVQRANVVMQAFHEDQCALVGFHGLDFASGDGVVDEADAAADQRCRFRDRT